jgi:sugar transferase (PEP-CTERM/EpsH1 system associated)
MKIFYLVSRIPYPINKGDKLRAFHQLKLLSDKHHIILFALTDEPISRDSLIELRKYCSEVIIYSISRWRIFFNIIYGIFKQIPFQVSYFFSKSVKKKIEYAIDTHKPDLIYCQLIRMAEYVKDINEVPKILDYVDAISKGLARRLDNSNLLLKSVIKLEYRRVLSYEKEVHNLFDKSIIITSQDREYLPVENKDEIVVIPNGIDFNYFQPMTMNKKYDLVFAGNMSYPPNISAAKFLAKKILPEIIKILPNIKCLIVGSSPNRTIKKLAAINVDVLGWVENIKMYYAYSKIFVAPLQLGTGLQNKILEAMAMEIPCIASSQANRGVNAPINDCILVADDFDEYYHAVLKLLNHPKQANKLAENARTWVTENYNWSNIAVKLNEVIDSC